MKPVFGLRALHLFICVLAVVFSCLGLWVANAAKKASSVTSIERLGGSVFYDDEFDQDGLYPILGSDTEMGFQAKSAFAKSLFSNARALILDPNVVLDTKMMVAIERLSDMKHLQADHVVLGEEQIEAISRLKSVEYLSLEGTKVSDYGLAKLVNLPRLKSLNVSGTNVTYDGLGQFESHPSLKTLWVRRLGLSVDERADLDRLLSGVDIYY